MSSCSFNVFFLRLIIVFNFGLHSGTSNKITLNRNSIHSTTSIDQNTTPAIHRRILVQGKCGNRDISISQSRDITSGIPQFIVEVVNTCVNECAPSNIHLHCGWFASARIVNPRTFKRLAYDDCLLNGGRPLKTSQVISFTYSNTFMYPLSFKYAKFC